MYSSAFAQVVRTLDVEKLDHSGQRGFSFDWMGNGTQSESSSLFIDDIEEGISLSPDSSGLSGKVRLYSGFTDIIGWSGFSVYTETAQWMNITGHDPLTWGNGSYHNQGSFTKAVYEVQPRSGTTDTKGVLDIDLGALYYDSETATMERGGPVETWIIREYPAPDWQAEDIENDILRIEYGRGNQDYGPLGEFHATVKYYNRVDRRLYTATFEDLGTAYLFLLRIPMDVGKQYQILQYSSVGILFEQQINLIHGTSSELELYHSLLEAGQSQNTITGEFGYYTNYPPKPHDPDGPVPFPPGVPENLEAITFTQSLLYPEDEEGNH
ncbi:RNA-binding protein [Lacunimicrobium album]